MKLTLEQLPGRLAKGLEPFYWVSGDEALLVQETAQAIRGAARQAGFTERRLLEADNGFDWPQLRQHANSLSLFSERCLLEVRCTAALNEAAKTALNQYAAQPPSDKVLLLTTPKLDNKYLTTAWFKQLETKSTVTLIKPLTPQQWPQWLQKRLQQAGLSTDAQGLQWLAARCEGNLLAAAQAIEKLALVHGAGPINATAMTTAVEDSSQFELFDLVDNALAGEALKTWHILQRLQHANLEPALILWILLREIRLLTAVAYANEHRLPLEPIWTQYRVWEKRQGLIKSAARRHASQQWLKLWQQAAQLDRVIKGILLGDVWQELTSLTLALAGAAPLPRLIKHDYPT